MARYRNKYNHRRVHPKIFVWAHTKKAEIDYFQDFKNYLKTPLLMPQKKICGTPLELLSHVIEWKNKEILEEDNDQVWCIFDVDDFYQMNAKNFLEAIKDAHKNNIKIAYLNECFELWILLHFEKPTSAILRGDLEKKIKQYFHEYKLGEFKKNQKIFRILLPFLPQALKNSQSLLPVRYENIDWGKALCEEGNPSTSLHFLVGEIELLIKEN